MIDPKLLRQDAHAVAKNLARRGYIFDADAYLSLEEKRKAVQVETQRLQEERNSSSKRVGEVKAKGKDIKSLLLLVKDLGDQLSSSENNLKIIQAKLREIELDLPNLLDDSVPDGQNENDNQTIREWGVLPEIPFQALDHIELGKNLNMIDFEAASKISGSRFTVISGSLARMQRALIQFMLDTHIEEHDYQEMYVPYLVKADALIGTGNLPKFEEDLFRTSNENPFYLIPTAEVPVTNLAKDAIFEIEDLPKHFVAHTPCFRSEAGSYGQDTKGMIRQHQFEKVELVHFVDAHNSMSSLELLTNHAEVILKKLELPYKVVSLCAGDIGFGSTKTYDLEVWLPGQNKYREISSCSNYNDFQARRMKARYRDTNSGKTELIHTLNGSGVAAGRALIAVMENYQNKDGSIRIPNVLKSYMGGLDCIAVQSN